MEIIATQETLQNKLTVLDKLCVLLVGTQDEDLQPQVQQLLNVLNTLKATNQPFAAFYRLDIENLPIMKDIWEIKTIPSVVFVMWGRLLDKVEGADTVAVVEMFKQKGQQFQQEFEDKKKQVFTKIQGIIARHSLVMFIKGDRNGPKCKFTRQLLEMLADNQVVNFETYDILSDEEVRQWIKIYSDWPTFPQIYAKGEFKGGVDILSDMIQNGQLKQELPSEAFA